MFCNLWQQSGIHISVSLKTVGFLLSFSLCLCFAALSLAFISRISHRTKALCYALNNYSRAAFSLEHWCVTESNKTELLFVPQHETDILWLTPFIIACHHYITMSIKREHTRQIGGLLWFEFVFPEWTDIYLWVKLSHMHIKQAITHYIMNHFIFVTW